MRSSQNDFTYSKRHDGDDHLDRQQHPRRTMWAIVVFRRPKWIILWDYLCTGRECARGMGVKLNDWDCANRFLVFHATVVSMRRCNVGATFDAFLNTSFCCSWCSAFTHILSVWDCNSLASSSLACWAHRMCLRSQPASQPDSPLVRPLDPFHAKGAVHNYLWWYHLLSIIPHLFCVYRFGLSHCVKWLVYRDSAPMHLKGVIRRIIIS